MKRFMLFVVVGLLVGLAGGTGAAFFMAGKTQEAPASDAAPASVGTGQRKAQATGGTKAARPAAATAGTNEARPATSAPTVSAESAAAVVRAALRRKSAPTPKGGPGAKPTTSALRPGAASASERPAAQLATRAGSPAATDPGAADPPSATAVGAAPRADPKSNLLNSQGARRLGKIFAAMQPADAAKVLEKLNDRAVEAILMRAGERPAAAILSHLSPERAAALSRVVLSSGSKP